MHPLVSSQTVVFYFHVSVVHVVYKLLFLFSCLIVLCNLT